MSGPKRSKLFKLAPSISRSVIVLAALVLAGFSAVSSYGAEDDPGILYADAVEANAKLDAEIRVLKSELTALRKLDAQSDSVILEGFKPDPTLLIELKVKLIELLESSFISVPQSLVGMDDESNHAVDELKRDLAAARNRLISDRKVLLEVRAQGQFLGQLASLINVDNKWLWLAGVIAFGTLIGLFVYDRRHAVRRLLWVRRSRAMALFAVGIVIFAIPLLPTIATFALGNQTFDKLLAITARQSAGVLGDDPAEQLSEIQGEAAKLKATRKQLFDEKAELLEKRHQRLIGVFSAKSKLPDEWMTMRDRITKSQVGRLITQSLSDALKEDVTRLQELKSSLKHDELLVNSYSQTKRLLGVAVGLALFGFVFLCGLAFQKSVNSRRKAISETCPRCLAVGRLTVEQSQAGILSELRCTNVFDDMTNDICDFTFPSQYRDRIKVSFPTLGVASSGKTFWVAMVYKQLNQGNSSTGVPFERIQSSGSIKFDRLVTDILQARLGLSATQIEMPEPLIFGFNEPNPLKLGVTEALVNIFDFAGTITATRGLHDSIRVRQLNSEGYLFFLDPSKESDKQLEALLKFREEVRLVKRLGAGKQLHTPVALCLTKLDTTVYQNYARGGDVITSFFEELNAIDSRTRPMSLTRLQLRSKLVGELRDTIWPSWEIENQIRGLFGERFMFFPMTPVGLPPQGMVDEDSINDLTQRSIEPYGILEPLLWLLHMNGYPLLKS